MLREKWKRIYVRLAIFNWRFILNWLISLVGHKHLSLNEIPL